MSKENSFLSLFRGGEGDLNIGINTEKYDENLLSKEIQLKEGFSFYIFCFIFGKL
jgi:hypothetical protein